MFFIGGCVWFIFGDEQRWTLISFHLCSLVAVSVVCAATFPGVGGHRCGAFVSLLLRDPYPTCARCRGTKCSADVTCDICKDWSVAQWEAFLKRRPYSERHKKCPSLCASDPTALHLGFF